MNQDEILTKIIGGRPGIVCKVFKKSSPKDGLLIQINSISKKRNIIYEEKIRNSDGIYQIDDFEIRYVDEIDTWNLQVEGFIGAIDDERVQVLLSEFLNEDVNFDKLEKGFEHLARGAQ